MIPWIHYPMTKMKTNKNSEVFYYEQKPSGLQKGILVILPGWSYIADTWSPMLSTNDFLKKHYLVYVLLNRGYKGEKKNVDFQENNTLDQFTKDIYDFIKIKDLKNITLLGHSIGCVYIWNMIALYGEERFKNYIIVDEPPLLLKNLDENENENEKLGAIYTKKSLNQAVQLLKGPKKDADEYKTSFIKNLFTASFYKNHPEIIEKVKKGTLEFNNHVLADILNNTVSIHNMTKLFSGKKIMKPALLIGGEESVIPAKSIRFQKRFYKHPTLYIFKKGSSHSMFIENYKTFNKVMDQFLKKQTNSKTTQKRKKTVKKGTRRL
jgi:pimeloyl-ACP methyl ester carboxylesterase